MYTVAVILYDHSHISMISIKKTHSVEILTEFLWSWKSPQGHNRKLAEILI